MSEKNSILGFTSICGIQVTAGKEKLVTVKDIQDLLMNAENDLSASSRVGLKPILFIDDANCMYRYMDENEGGQEILGSDYPENETDQKV